MRLSTALRTGYHRRLLLRLTAFGLCFVLGGVAGFPAAADEPDEESEELTVALVFDGPSDTANRIAHTFADAFAAEYEGDTEPEFPRRYRFTGSWSRASVARKLGEAENEESVDLVIALGPLGSQILAESAVAEPEVPEGFEEPELSKPAIAAALLPAELQTGTPLEEGRGLEEIIAIELPLRLERDLQRAMELFAADRAALLVPGVYLREFAHLETAIEELLDTRAFAGLLPVTPDDQPDELFEQLSVIAPDAEMVLSAPLLMFSPAQRERLFETLADEGVAALSVLGRRPLDHGAGGVLRQAGIEKIATRAAVEWYESKVHDRVFDGAHIPRPERALLLHSEVLHRAGLQPRHRALLEAEFVGTFSDSEEKLDPEDTDREGMQPPASINLIDAVRRSLKANLELKAKGFAPQIAAAERDQARSLLLPQVEAGTSFRVIDQQRAETPIAPDQFSAVGELQLEQVLWSEQAWANLNIREQLAESEEYQYATARADTAETTAQAYLDLLRARSLVQLRRGNVAEHRFNLERARTRRELGQAGPEDVYRFRSEKTLARKELTEALAMEEKARIQLNRLMDLPQQQPLVPTEHGIDDPTEILSASRVFTQTEGLFRLHELLERVVDRALADSPELAALDHGVLAREREHRMRRRAYYSPTLGLLAEVGYEYWSGGTSFEADEVETEEITFEYEGEEITLAPMEIDVDELYDEPGPLEWSGGIRLSIPLSTGGERCAALEQTDAELQQLRAERDSVFSQIEQRARTAFVETVSAAAAIAEAREAADAAEDALELTSRAYEHGLTSAGDLVDVQERSLEARILVRNTVYEYLQKIVFLLRALAADDALADRQAHYEIGRFLQRHAEEESVYPEEGVQ